MEDRHDPDRAIIVHRLRPGGADSQNRALWRIDDHVELRSEEHTSELQSLVRISYAVFCLKKKKKQLYKKKTERERRHIHSGHIHITQLKQKHERIQNTNNSNARHKK